MKLALVRRSFSALGGAELYLQRLLGALRSEGHELHLFAESWANPPPGVVLHTVPVRSSRSRRPWAFALAVEKQLAAGQFNCVFSLERTLRQTIYRAGDGVHRVWLQRRREYSPWWRTLWIAGFHRAMMRLERETLNPANTRFIIVNSEMVRKEIHEHFRFPLDRMILVRNGVDVQRFRSGDRQKTRLRFGFRADDFVCLFVGSGWERKGLRYVIEAVRRIGGTVKLLVVGKGREFFAGPNVMFAGACSDVENMYAAADLFTFLPIYEPSANVCIEALAAGLPVVTSQFNGAGELIETTGQGRVLPDPSDVEAIVSEIRSRVASPRRAAIEEEKISLERNVRETLRVIETAAKTT